MADKKPVGRGEVTTMHCRKCRTRFNVVEDYAATIRCPSCDGRLDMASKDPLAAVSLKGDPIGQSFGGCKVGERIGEGSYGSVYRAQHSSLKREVALKMVRLTSRKRPLLKRLVFEARTIARIEHANIVQVHDVGVQAPFLFIVMELLDGGNLREKMNEDGTVPPDEAVEIARQIARGLHAAHIKGVVHRDVKPANVMVVGDTYKLVDFGLALDIESIDEYKGMVVGTPHCLPPEQWLGKTVDARSDLYSLGVILYEMVTGRTPFKAKSLHEMMKHHLRSVPTAPHRLNPAVREGLSAIILKLMAKDPTRRYVDARALLSDLDRYEQRQDVRAMVESKRVIRCQMCDTLNPSQETHCKICGESLRKVPLEMSSRGGEFNCPKCERSVDYGRRQCPACQTEFCRMCRTRIAVLKGVCELCG